MKPIIEKVFFYPYRTIFCEETGVYAIERYDSVKHQWIIMDCVTGEQHVAEEQVHELNMEAGKVEEAYIVGYVKKKEGEEEEEEDKENEEEK